MGKYGTYVCDKDGTVRQVKEAARYDAPPAETPEDEHEAIEASKLVGLDGQPLVILDVPKIAAVLKSALDKEPKLHTGQYL